MYIRTAWEDYFPATNPTNLNSQTYISRQTPSGTSIYVSKCLFVSITSESNGGAFYCTSVTYLLIESTSFFSCKTSGSEGGAIYIMNSGGQSVFHEVCGYDCCSTCTSGSNFQFARVEVNNVVSSKNYINYSSIVRCVNDKSSTYNMLGLHNGKICCSSVNISMNSFKSFSGITCWHSSSSNSLTCLLTYSSFSDNHATVHNCFWLATGGAKYEIKSCNILRNTQVSSSIGTIYTDGNLMIEDSCILENNATNIFYQSSSSYTITLSNCTADRTSNNQNLITQNTITKSFILALDHMSTRNCHSAYDSAGYLTPIPQHLSSSKEQIQCHTCGNFFHHPRLTDTFSSIFIFIFNFIQAGTSSYH
jgi:hypothetical protein